MSIFNKFAAKSIRGYTNGLILIFRTLISGLLVDVVWIEVGSQKEGDAAHGPRYLLTIALILIVSISFAWEWYNNNAEEKLNKQIKQFEIAEKVQGRVLEYALTDLVDAATDFDSKIKILRLVPQLVTTISVDEVLKSMNQGFQLVADSFLNLQSDFKDSTDEMKDKVEETLQVKFDEILNKLKGGTHPRPKTVSAKELSDMVKKSTQS